MTFGRDAALVVEELKKGRLRSVPQMIWHPLYCNCSSSWRCSHHTIARTVTPDDNQSISNPRKDGTEEMGDLRIDKSRGEAMNKLSWKIPKDSSQEVARKCNGRLG